MKKKEYEFPEMEIVEIKGLCSILAGSGDDDDDIFGGGTAGGHGGQGGA